MGTYTKLKREVVAESLARIEQSARTQADFENVAREWDKADELRERRERRHEVSHDVLYNERDLSDCEVPLHLNKRLWVQIFNGDFIDAIFDCPYEIHELTSNEYISGILKDLSEDQKEIFYLWVIRGFSPQLIAKIRGQTDRNIRKVYKFMIEKVIRKKLNIDIKLKRQ